MAMVIPDDLAERLLAIARQEKRPPEAVLRSLLDQYPAEPERDQPNLALLRMAEAAEALGLRTDENDISERFDEVLKTTWADNLNRKWTDDER